MAKAIEARQRDTMRMLHEYIDRFPVASTTIHSILAVQQNAAKAAEEIERLAATDPMLAVKMLYLANHTFLGMPDAGVTIGSIMAHVGSNAIVASLRDSRETTPVAPTRLEARDLWNHSANVAAVAAHLGRQAPGLGVKPAEAFLAGLVHDLGRFIMMVADPKAFEAIERAEWRGGDDLVREEVAVTGFNHAVLGWLANRAWNFPDSLAAVCRYHHQWASFDHSCLTRRTAALVRLVGLADEIVFIYERDFNSARDIPEALAEGQSLLRSIYGTTLTLGAASECERILTRLDQDLRLCAD